ncbi:MAG: PaaI family thioesterase [Bauldia litoralis]
MNERDLVGEEPTSGFRGLVGYVIDVWREGYCEMVLEMGPQHGNRSGVLHGGVVSTLIDAACGYAGCYCPDPDRVRKAVTLSLNTHFVKAATGGEVRAIGRLKGGGRRIFFSSAELVDARGNTLALGDGSFRYFRGSEDPAGVPVDTRLAE